MLKRDDTRTIILKTLQEIGGAVGASRIAERLGASGLTLKPRTVRYYLLQLDREGMTSFVSRRRGRVLTDRGREEIAHANVLDKVGFVSARVDTLGYRMTYNRRTGAGTIIANLTVMHERAVSAALKELAPVFERGLGMGRLVALAGAGRRVADFEVPENSVVLATVCSVTVNGILLAEGIPVTSRFGGLLEMRDGEPVRFVELIDYAGSTLDPVECFINAGMTQVRRCARTGSGIIGASFREIPSAAAQAVQAIGEDMAARGLGGILAVGRPNRPLLDIPVAEGRAGLVVVAGLNAPAAMHEAGLRMTLRPMAGLEDIGVFGTFEEVRLRHE